MYTFRYLLQFRIHAQILGGFFHSIILYRRRSKNTRIFVYNTHFERKFKKLKSWSQNPNLFNRREKLSLFWQFVALHFLIIGLLQYGLGFVNHFPTSEPMRFLPIRYTALSTVVTDKGPVGSDDDHSQALHCLARRFFLTSIF